MQVHCLEASFDPHIYIQCSAFLMNDYYCYTAHYKDKENSKGSMEKTTKSGQIDSCLACLCYL